MSNSHCIRTITPQFQAIFQIPIEKDFRMKYSDSNYGKKIKRKSEFESRITAFANSLIQDRTTSMLSPSIFICMCKEAHQN